MMLVLITAQLGVLPTAPPSQQALVSGATQAQVCVSTEVDVRTQTCNNECNSAWHSCPTACFCLAASNRSAQRGINSAWRSMESEDLEQLSHSLKRRWDTVPEKADARQDAAFRDAADAALREAMEARKLEELLGAIHDNNGHASPEVLDEARALRDELKDEKKHAPTAEKVDPAECQEWCVEQSTQWPGRHAREQFCSKADCRGCEFCSQSKEVTTEDGSAPAANSPLPAKPAWKSQISAAQPARLLDEEIVGFCAQPHSRLTPASLPPHSDLTPTSCTKALLLLPGLTLLHGRTTDSKTWLCKTRSSPTCTGPAAKNLHVAFSGENTLEIALERSLVQLSECNGSDNSFCNSQLRYATDTRAESIAKLLAPGSWTAERCRGCFLDDPALPPNLRPSELEKNNPFAKEAGLFQGMQFLDIGGASARGVLTVETLQSFFAGGLDKVKDAGFDGVCFDVEMTRGEETALVKELERAFAACKQAGLLVMVTTSHSAPFASSTLMKGLLIDSWVHDDNIDLFSPQLYTSGTEGKPEFMLTPCGTPGQSKCSWERLAPMKAKWVLSLASGDQYPAAKAFFNKLDIKPIGYIQWKEPMKASDADTSLHIAAPVDTNSALPRPRDRSHSP
jgi:hypothetical protein